jgi:hypothetical protein
MWFWKITFWTRRNDGGWLMTGQTGYFRANVQKAQVEHSNAWEDSGQTTVLLYWSATGWIKYEQLD